MPQLQTSCMTYPPAPTSVLLSPPQKCPHGNRAVLSASQLHFRAHSHAAALQDHQGLEREQRVNTNNKTNHKTPTQSGPGVLPMESREQQLQEAMS